MTVKDLLSKLDDLYRTCANKEQAEIIDNYELQFHYDCIWYKIGDLEIVDEKNKRIIFKSSKRWASRDDY